MRNVQLSAVLLIPLGMRRFIGQFDRIDHLAVYGRLLTADVSDILVYRLLRLLYRCVILTQDCSCLGNDLCSGLRQSARIGSAAVCCTHLGIGGNGRRLRPFQPCATDAKHRHKRQRDKHQRCHTALFGGCRQLCLDLAENFQLRPVDGKGFLLFELHLFTPSCHSTGYAQDGRKAGVNLRGVNYAAPAAVFSC